MEEGQESEAEAIVFQVRDDGVWIVVAVRERERNNRFGIY